MSENVEKYSLFVGQAFYECKSFSPQIPCLMDAFRTMEELGIRYTYIQINGDSYVSRAKNALVHAFLKSDFTHLMILDSDHTWNLEGFMRLLRASLAGFEVVAGLYPCKNNWDFYGGWPRMDKNGFLLGKEEGDIRVLDMQVIPGGFVIYSREAFERTRPFLDSYIAAEDNEEILEAFQDGIEFAIPRLTVEDMEPMLKEDLIAEVLKRQRGERSAGRIGEDVYFQRRYLEAGGKLWCEPNIDIGHIGIKEWRGNYQEHLLNCRGVGEPKAQEDLICELA